MSDNERGIYKIPKENLPKFQKMLEKLSKKSEKLTGERIHFVPFNTITEKHGGFVREYVEVLLSGFEAPKLNGWSFVARLDHANDIGTIVRPVPGFVVPEMYRDRGSVCDHCGIKRYRRDTYLVKHNETGETKQIGSSCLKDFLGHQHPEKIAKMAQILGYADEVARGVMSIGEDRRWIDLEAYLAHVALMIDRHGYMSQASAKRINATIEDQAKQVQPTSTRAISNLLPDPRYKDLVEMPSDRHIQLAQAAIAWAASLGEDGTVLSDYSHNIHVLAASGMIEFRSIGYASSIVGTYMREHGLFKSAEKRPTNHVGVVGSKLELDVEYVKSRWVSSETGGFYVHEFMDAEGNKLAWMTGTGVEAEVGTKLKLKGTVKAHNEFKGVKSTIMTRCKLS